MNKLMAIGIVALTVACNRGAHNGEMQSPGGEPGRTAQAAQGSGDRAPARAGDQAITLVGCLQGPPLAVEPTGTAGSERQSGATGAAGTVPAPGGGAPAARFTLVNARSVSGDAGAGANGAGGSGGPVASGTSSYDLDGMTADAAAHVNKEVRVTGRVDSNPGLTATDRSAPAPDPESAGHGGGAPTAGRRYDTAGHGSSADSQAGATRRVIVESIQVVNDTCARR